LVEWRGNNCRGLQLPYRKWVEQIPNGFVVSTSRIPSVLGCARLSWAIHLQGLARSYRAITTFLTTWTIPAILRWWRWKVAPNLPWKCTGVIGNKATGPGTIIQSNYGLPNHLGNFEVIVLEGTNIVFHYRDNSDLNWKFGGIITNSTSGWGQLKYQTEKVHFFDIYTNKIVIIKYNKEVFSIVHDLKHERVRTSFSSMLFMPEVTKEQRVVSSETVGSHGFSFTPRTIKLALASIADHIHYHPSCWFPPTGQEPDDFLLRPAFGTTIITKNWNDYYWLLTVR
jgi:hypothetical protein